MLKRGQITIFLILGLVVMIIIGFSVYITKFGEKKKSAAAAKSLESKDAEIVKAYAETCLKMASEDALFSRIGLHGGYINPGGAPEYGEGGVANPSPTSFLGNKVPYYLEGVDTGGITAYYTFLPDLAVIKKKLENYIAVEFEKCFNASDFEDIGMNVTKPVIDYPEIGFDFSKTTVNVDVSLNEEDVSVHLTYPLIVKAYGTEAEYESFRVVLPIRMKILYDSAAELVENIKNAQPYAYDISQYCGNYDKNGLTNIYLKLNDSGAKEIIQFVDFSTYEQNYFNSYIFQFAVKNVNATGSCVG